MEDSFVFIQNLVFSLLLGGLVGLEREKRRQKEDSHEFGGIRTLSLAAVFGYLVTVMFGSDPWLFGLFSAGFGALVLASYIATSYIGRSTGATTELAAFFVYLVGVLVGSDAILYASVITLVLVLLLYAKEQLHRFASRVEQEEFYDTLKFIAIAFVVLPLLPNEYMGPLEVFNPHNLWLIVVLISSISFVSYIGIKLLGARNGIGLGGFLGGLISSTAVSMSFSQMSAKSKKIVNAFVFGIVVASSAMFFRVLVEVFLLNRELMHYVWLPMVVMGAVGLLATGYFWWTKSSAKTKVLTCKDLNLTSPFQLKPALKFGVLFAVLLFVSKYVSSSFGAEALYATAIISGLVDVDAITVSMANLTALGELPLKTGAVAVILAAMSNTLSKGVIVLTFASRPVGRRTFFTMLLMLAAGIVTVFLTL